MERPNIDFHKLNSHTIFELIREKLITHGEFEEWLQYQLDSLLEFMDTIEHEIH